MLKLSLYDYSSVYILVKSTMSVANTAAAGADTINTDKEVVFQNCAPFNGFIGQINNRQIDNAKDIDAIMLCIT